MWMETSPVEGATDSDREAGSCPRTGRGKTIRASVQAQTAAKALSVRADASEAMIDS